MQFCIRESFSNFMMITLDELIVHLRTSLAQRKLPHWHGGFKTRIAYGHCAEQNNSFRATLLVLNVERSRCKEEITNSEPLGVVPRKNPCYDGVCD